MAAAAAMKAKGDFTALRDDDASIVAVRTAGMPADKVLSVDTIAQADAAARWVVVVAMHEWLLVGWEWVWRIVCCVVGSRRGRRRVVGGGSTGLSVGL